jgi:predicted TIM-barrel fold metal-dependent hydrolase
VTTAAASPAGATGTTKPFIVDCDSHIMPSTEDLAPYLPQRWRRYLATFGLRTPGELGMVRARWMACRADAWSPTGRQPGSDPAFFREQLLDAFDVDRAVLNSVMMSAQVVVGGNQPRDFTAALMTAANDWTAEHWIAFDERMYASICSPFEDPRAAVREIERWAGERFVQILLPFRLQRPLGSPFYWPLFEAATALDLPIALHPGSIGNNMITGAGWPSYYYEDHVGLPQALMNQIASLICEGAFDRFPTLKIVFLEGGWSWITPYVWRLERAFDQLAEEVTHVRRRPSEYVHDHFWFATQPIEEPGRPEELLEALEILGMPDRLLFSSDYPHWDFDAPDEAIPLTLPVATRRSILGTNALGLYRQLAPPA